MGKKWPFYHVLYSYTYSTSTCLFPMWAQTKESSLSYGHLPWTYHPVELEGFIQWWCPCNTLHWFLPLCCKKVSTKKLALSGSSAMKSSKSTRFQDKNTYDKERDGNWNWGRECGFSSSHGSSPDVRPHICDFYAYKSRKTLNHKEKDCVNKTGLGNTKTQSTSSGKDFY